MSDVDKLLPLTFRPGIQRDGTQLDTDAPTYIDGEWVRFQRGRPRKMGGYVKITENVNGPIRHLSVYPQNGFAKVICFSTSSIEELLLDKNASGSEVYNRTPVDFVPSEDLIWISDVMFDDAVGSENSIMLAACSESKTYIDSDNEGSVYFGLMSDQSVFEEISGVTAKGVFVAQPYAVYYGAYGKVTWSNANEPLNITTGEAGTDRVTGRHIVAGKSLSSGSGTGGLLFSLDSVIRMDWIGGNQIFKFNTLTTSSSILSHNAVVEHDGLFYWAGVDRFFVSDGQSVKTLPNTTNVNWFFENLNLSAKTSVWATKNARFNEIIWHFPFGTSEECDKAIVFNIVENCWYDYSISRSAGDAFYTYPIESAYSKENARVRLVLSGEGLDVSVGDTLVGVSSQYSATVDVISGGVYYATMTYGNFIIGEELTNTTNDTTAYLDYVTRLTSVYKHESGYDRIENNNQLAIRSSYTTSNIGVTSISDPINRWTRIIRVEPDFVQTGDISMYVLTKEFANSETVSHGPYQLTKTTEKHDLGIQGRHVFIKFESDVVRGNYQQGKIFFHVEAGDARS